MDDTQAEAVLLLLGPKLEWYLRIDRFRPDGQWEGRCADSSDSGVYYVWGHDEKWAITYYGDGYFEDADKAGAKAICPSTQASLIAAKTSCERHYATGKWE